MSITRPGGIKRGTTASQQPKAKAQESRSQEVSRETEDSFTGISKPELARAFVKGESGMHQQISQESTGPDLDMATSLSQLDAALDDFSDLFLQFLGQD